ncbi:hypothetical protein DdX_00793 [Ditylenchus destructor]|uniref:Nanos-type domain-containing protein n=1 Tax=Ditylenchus destructor TaxID=166010 RepID=A0AAD4RAQ7_9BILA|nr:hypothetical protein DdX_00793 [Ditylenchus destructor]
MEKANSNIQRGDLPGIRQNGNNEQRSYPHLSLPDTSQPFQNFYNMQPFSQGYGPSQYMPAHGFPSMYGIGMPSEPLDIGAHPYPQSNPYAAQNPQFVPAVPLPSGMGYHYAPAPYPASFYMPHNSTSASYYDGSASVYRPPESSHSSSNVKTRTLSTDVPKNQLTTAMYEEEYMTHKSLEPGSGNTSWSRQSITPAQNANHKGNEIEASLRQSPQSNATVYKTKRTQKNNTSSNAKVNSPQRASNKVSPDKDTPSKNMQTDVKDRQECPKTKDAPYADICTAEKKVGDLNMEENKTSDENKSVYDDEPDKHCYYCDKILANPNSSHSLVGEKNKIICPRLKKIGCALCSHDHVEFRCPQKERNETFNDFAVSYLVNRRIPRNNLPSASHGPSHHGTIRPSNGFGR